MCCRFAFIGSCLLVARVLCSEQRAVEVVSALRDAADLVEKGLLTVEEYRDIKRDLMVPLKYGATEGSMQKLPKFFGTALAAHTLQPRTELTVLDYQVQGDDGATLTLFQYLGEKRDGFNDTRIRYYIDGEQNASIDYLLYLGVGLGFNGSTLEQRAWGTSRVGSLAYYSTYSTIRVPFTSRLRITVEMPPYNNAAQLIWVDIRGAEALPVTIGDAITLLPTEYRLRLHKNENVFVPSGDMIPMAMTNRSGLMFMTAIQVNASAYNFLEGCWRARLGDPKTNWTLLTSGGEEMFLGAYYFDSQDTAILPFVGLTRKEVTNGASTLSAFVEYSEYPITFDKGGFQFIWQNGASFDRSTLTRGQKCGPSPNPYGGPRGGYGPPIGVEHMVLTSYVWLYEAIGDTPFPSGAPPPPPPPFSQWGPTPPCPEADCSGVGVVHGRNWGGPATNGTVNGTGIATDTAAACASLCVADQHCSAMTWKSSHCTDVGVGPCGGPNDACCYLLLESGRLDNSSGWCTWIKPKGE